MAGVKSPFRREVPPEQIRRMREARAQGWAIKQLSTRFGVMTVKGGVVPME